MLTMLCYFMAARRFLSQAHKLLYLPFPVLSTWFFLFLTSFSPWFFQAFFRHSNFHKLWGLEITFHFSLHFPLTFSFFFPLFCSFLQCRPRGVNMRYACAWNVFAVAKAAQDPALCAPAGAPVSVIPSSVIITKTLCNFRLCNYYEKNTHFSYINDTMYLFHPPTLSNIK